MRAIVFDIETRNVFADVGAADPALLDISIVAAYDSATGQFTSYLQEELPQLWPMLEQADILVGYNSDHFDIPLLNKYYTGDLTKIKSIDLLKEIKKSIGRRVRLDQVAQGTLGTRKSGHGLEAVEWWKTGQIDKIRKYCIKDVEITKNVYEYALNNKKLFFKEDGKSIEIPIDTSDWHANTENGMTHTLPF